MRRTFLALAAGVFGGVLFSSAALAQGAVLDHMICYKVLDRLLPKATADLLADLQPEFTQKGCVIGKPLEFCVPATKTNVNPAPANPNIVGQPLSNDYICYQAKCPNQMPPPSKLVIDQFGKRQQRRYIPTKICVPAKKTSIDCGFVNGTTMCGGACTDPTATCQINSAGDACTCVPKNTCDGRPDKAGTCGGTCDNPALRCLPDVTSATSNAPVCRCKDPLPPVCSVNTATGVCGGSCPNTADKCVIDAAGQCTCQHVPAPCGMDPASKTCGGACPGADQTCLPDAATNACSCQPPAGCSGDPLTGTCAGACPNAGEQCLSSATGCGCQPVPCSSDAAGVCGGACPIAGQACKADSTGACNCSPPPCSTDAAGVCGGVCPVPGETCAVDANGTCGCSSAAPCGGPVQQCSGTCPAGQTCGVQVGIPDFCGCR